MACKVSAEKSLIDLWGLPCTWLFIFLLLVFRILSLSLTFAILIIVRLGVDIFGFISFGALCVSCTWISASFFRFRMFPAIISSNTFSTPFSLSSPSRTPIMQMIVCLMKSQRSLKLSSFLKFVFLFTVLIGWFPLFYLADHLCTLLYHLICY